MKSIIIFISILFMTTLGIILFIGKKNIKSSEIIPKETKLNHSYKFGLISGRGGFGDRSFNDIQYNGMVKVKKRYGIPFSVKEPHKAEDFNRLALELINEDSCNVIFVGSFEWKKEVDLFSQKYKDVKFIILDCEALRYHKNLASIKFKQNEVAYLAGVLSALTTKSSSIGIIGATRIKPIEDFIVGYKAGAEHINPNIKFIENYLTEKFKGINPWESLNSGSKLAFDMIEKYNVDIIFSLAGASNMGIFKTCSIKNIFAIGVDADQDYLEKGTILTSAMKNLDKAILFMAKVILDGNFENRSYVLGLKEGGVGLSKMKFTKKIIGKEIINKVKNIESQILSDKIIVPSAF
ncbi:MAG: hypothetical protein CR982_10495 [Candidatus Cloacimonadota bacterium]|nr:MAG: hypothetical protein CR982_10495 [Candidatus Cloacimonadota bacterium]PIE79006.1 MAG: hypothetical protein CSA15_04955 [Candidatus Delongbacteria bacterium]